MNILREYREVDWYDDKDRRLFMFVCGGKLFITLIVIGGLVMIMDLNIYLIIFGIMFFFYV